MVLFRFPLLYFFRMVLRICVSYSMVCAYVLVREDNPRALASGLSPVHMHKPYNNCLIAPACMRTLCDVEHWNITQRRNKVSI